MLVLDCSTPRPWRQEMDTEVQYPYSWLHVGQIGPQGRPEGSLLGVEG